MPTFYIVSELASLGLLQSTKFTVFSKLLVAPADATKIQAGTSRVAGPQDHVQNLTSD
jgi:hypothetical protein